MGPNFQKFQKSSQISLFCSSHSGTAWYETYIASREDLAQDYVHLYSFECILHDDVN